MAGQTLFANAIAAHLNLLAITGPTRYTPTGEAILPIVFAALLLDVAIVVIWYFAGVVLNNNKVKESAKGEYYQFIGTVVITMLILWAMVTMSSLFYSVLSTTHLLNPTAISTMCANLEANSMINLVGGTNSLLSGATANGNTLTGFCQVLSGSSLTERIDYPLATTSVIIANLTNQTATNLNSGFIIDAWIGFLSKVSPTFGFCFGEPEIAFEQCLLQGTTSGPPPAPNTGSAGSAVTGTSIVPSGGTTGAEALPPGVQKYQSGQLGLATAIKSGATALQNARIEIDVKFQPYSGYSLLLTSINTFGAMITTSLESFIAQLLILSIFIYIWPFLLFGGLLLRSTFFTRKLGGLLIAVVIGVMIIFPLLFSLEYLVLSNVTFVNSAGTALYNIQNPLSTVSPGVNTTYGFNAVTPLPESPTNLNSNYVVNFFVEPSVEAIALKNNCWPGVSGLSEVGIATTNPLIGSAVLAGESINPLTTSEVTDLVYLALPGGAISAAEQIIQSVYDGHMTSYYLPAFCPVNGALQTVMSIINAYGIIGVTSFFIPIINLIITMTAIVGLSGLMGGDVSLGGLSRFL